MARRRTTNDDTRRENAWIYIAIIVMFGLLVLALYGYVTGAFSG